jgi:hypothetical protein
MKFLLALAGLVVAACGDGSLVGIASGRSPSGANTLTAVTVDPSTGAPTKLASLNASLGYFNDNTAAADDAHGVYYTALAISLSTSAIIKIDLARPSSPAQYEYVNQMLTSVPCLAALIPPIRTG